MNRLLKYKKYGYGGGYTSMNYSSAFSNPSNTGWQAPGNAAGGPGFGEGPSSGVMGMDTAGATQKGVGPSAELTGAAAGVSGATTAANAVSGAAAAETIKTATKTTKIAAGVSGGISAAGAAAGGVFDAMNIDAKEGADTFNVAEKKEFKKIKAAQMASSITASTAGTIAGATSWIPGVGWIIGAAAGAVGLGGTIASEVYKKKEEGLLEKHKTRLKKDESQRIRDAERASAFGTASRGQAYGQSYAKYGGLKKYQTGGKIRYTEGVPVSKANAELEGRGKKPGEVIVPNNDWKNVIQVKGPTHEQGGVPVKLREGDKVLSDHIIHPDTKDTIAETYADTLKRGASQAELEGIWDTQEALAGRDPGQGMDQVAQKGGLMKYQFGTPGGWSPQKKKSVSNFPAHYSNTGIEFLLNPDPSVQQFYAGKKADEIIAKAKAKTVAPAAKKQAAPPPPVTPPTTGLAGYFHHQFPLKEAKVNRTGYDNPDARLSSYTAPEKTGSNYLKYAPEMISGLGSLAGIIATATQKFNKVPIPPHERVKADKMFLDRMSPSAEIARSERDFASMMSKSLKMGQGPGASSMIQDAYLSKTRAEEAAREGANKFNIGIDAAEKSGNIESKLKADMFNEENAARYREMLFAQNTASEAFSRERTQSIVNQILKGTQAVGDTAMNRRYAEAVSGDTGALERFKRTGLQADLDKFLASLKKS